MKPYSPVRIRLTKSQIDKICNSIKKNTGTVIRISNKSIDFRNGLEIYLTQTQIKKLKSSSNPININLSNDQVRKMVHSGKGSSKPFSLMLALGALDKTLGSIF